MIGTPGFRTSVWLVPSGFQAFGRTARFKVALFCAIIPRRSTLTKPILRFGRSRNRRRNAGFRHFLTRDRSPRCGDYGKAKMIHFFSTNDGTRPKTITFPGENPRIVGENSTRSCGQIQKRLWNIWGICRKKDFLINFAFFWGRGRGNSPFCIDLRRFLRVQHPFFQAIT
jgi:hypothetical protein